MKYTVSVSLDEEAILKIRDCLMTRSFRSKSHVVEEAIKEFRKGGNR